MSPAPDKAKLFGENFAKNSNLDEAVVFLPAFPSWTNLKLQSFSVIPKFFIKVITNLDSSKASGPGCIPLVVLKKCKPKLSYMLAELFTMCLKEFCFLDCWKVVCGFVFKNVKENSAATSYGLVNLLSVVSKIF